MRVLSRPRFDRSTIALSLLCAALAAGIGVEIVAAITPDEGHDTPISPLPPTPDHPPEESDASRLASILARPLFTPDRHPAPEAPGDGASGLPTDLRLAGVVLAPGMRSALMVRPGQAATIVTGIGDMVDGWRITAIGPAGVTLSDAGREIFLEPKSAGMPDRAGSPSPAGQPGGPQAILPPPAYRPPTGAPAPLPPPAFSPAAKKRKPR